MRPFILAAFALLFSFNAHAKEVDPGKCDPAVKHVLVAGSMGLAVMEMPAPAAGDWIADFIAKRGMPPSGVKPVSVIVVTNAKNPTTAIVLFVNEHKTVCDYVKLKGPPALEAVSLARGDASY